MSGFLFIQRANLKYYILIFKNYYNHYNSTGLLENLSNQNVVNNIYDRIFDFYINNDFRHLEQYDNKLELFNTTYVSILFILIILCAN